MAQPANRTVVQALPEPEIVSTETVIVATPATRRVRMRGTSTLHYGGRSYDFVANQWVELPDEVATYVTQYGMTFDT